MTNLLGYGVQISVWPKQGDKVIYQEMGVGGHFLGHSEAASAIFKRSLTFPCSDTETMREGPESKDTLKSTDILR